MARYASDTEVTVSRSIAEIDHILTRYGADGFGYGRDGTRAVIWFRLGGRHVRFELPLPDPEAAEFTRTPARGTKRSPEQAQAAWEQACRQRWRALALAVKAKLEVVETNIQSFDEEFLAYIVLPDGRRVSDHVLPAIEAAYESGRTPKGLLPEFGG